MSRSLDAALVPLVLVLGDSIGLALWAPPYRDGDGDEVEGFLGTRDRVYAFSSAEELAVYVQAHPQSDFDDHPAWPGIVQRSAADLRAEPDDVIDFEDVYPILTGDPTVESATALSRIIQIAVAVADACNDDHLASLLAAPAYRHAVYGPNAFTGTTGLRLWGDVSEEATRSWNQILERLEDRIEWRGDQQRVDPAALRKPGRAASPWIGTSAGLQPALVSAGPAYVSSVRLPSRWPTVLVTALFGVFGLIPAAVATSEARSLGEPTGRYWAAFFWTLLIEVLAWVLLIAVVVSAVTTAGS